MMIPTFFNNALLEPPFFFFLCSPVEKYISSNLTSLYDARYEARIKYLAYPASSKSNTTNTGYHTSEVQCRRAPVFLSNEDISRKYSLSQIFSSSGFIKANSLVVSSFFTPRITYVLALAKTVALITLAFDRVLEFGEQFADQVPQFTEIETAGPHRRYQYL